MTAMKATSASRTTKTPTRSARAFSRFRSRLMPRAVSGQEGLDGRVVPRRTSLGRAAHGEAALDEDGHAVGDGPGHVDVVGHDHGRVAHAPAQLRAISSTTSFEFVGSSPAVGSSNSSISGSTDDRAGDPDALAHPARQLGGQEPRGRRSTRPTSAGSGPRARRSPPPRGWCARAEDTRRSRAPTANRRARRPGRRSPSGAAAGAAPPRTGARWCARRPGAGPASGRIRPATSRRRTVLPAPLPPMTTSVSPLASANDTPRRTGFASKLLFRSAASTIGSVMAINRRA